MRGPLDPASSCPAARDYSRAYLHHLVKSQEYLAAMLLSWANVAFYQELMAAMRAAIAEGRFAAWAAQTKARLGRWGQTPDLNERSERPWRWGLTPARACLPTERSSRPIMRQPAGAT